MRHNPMFSVLFFIALAGSMPANCQTTKLSDDYLLSVYDEYANPSGYVNLAGDTVIAIGKYPYCFTDTFRTYAIVANKDSPFLTAIDRKENVLYEVFNYDNGPDYPAEGLFRIMINHKIGYADAATGKIVIQPQFDCAFAFTNGVAQVGNNCKKEVLGEYSIWVSDHSVYIDKTGKKVEEPKAGKE